MTGTAHCLADAAQGMVGSRFRLHGRDPATGLDCVGLLAASLAACGVPAWLPTGYPLRLMSLEGWMPDTGAMRLSTVNGPAEPGDVVIVAPGPAQYHLAIAGRDGGWIHAHAGLRRVVHSACLPDGPIVGHWRFAPVQTKV
ncbi:MAG: hypothetical protein KGM49_04740 [Sphingomonadales bacterium]|nr:hypothetical protein [Sphingomonadales bacterium]